jgi:hypothetical protein
MGLEPRRADGPVAASESTGFAADGPRHPIRASTRQTNSTQSGPVAGWGGRSDGQAPPPIAVWGVSGAETHTAVT